MPCFAPDSNSLLAYSFKTAAERFRLIESNTHPVLIPWGAKGRKLCEEIRELKKNKTAPRIVSTTAAPNNSPSRFTTGMSIKSAPNCGQVRGPVQISFSRSVDPIQQAEHSITRMAVTKEEDFAKERTMCRKFTVPYGLYRCHGFVNPFLADQTGFSEEEDLELFFQALENAFQFDQSAARPAGSMAPRALLVFRHDGTDTDEVQRAKQAKLGCAPSHTLFDLLKIESFEEKPAGDGKPPRKFSDYVSHITFDGKPLDEFIAPPNGKATEKDLLNGITLIRRI